MRDLRPLSLDDLPLESSVTDHDTMTDEAMTTVEVAMMTADRGTMTATTTDRGTTIVAETTDDSTTDPDTTIADGTTGTMTDETTEADGTMTGGMTVGRNDETIGLMTVVRALGEMSVSEALLPGREPRTAQRMRMADSKLCIQKQTFTVAMRIGEKGKPHKVES